MDYRLIDDVSVEQDCSDFITGAGALKVHCSGSSDPSIIAEERKRLVEGLQTRDLVKLKQAVRICSLLDSKAGLKDELEEAKVREACPWGTPRCTPDTNTNPLAAYDCRD